MEVGGRAPSTSTAALWRPISSLASRQCALHERLARIGAAAGERDLTRVAAHVVAALGEQQARVLWPIEDRDEDGGVLAAVNVERGGLRRDRAGAP